MTGRSSSTGSTKTRTLLGGIAAQLLTIGIARFAFTPLMPLMQAQAGLTYREGAWLGSAIYIGYLAGAMALVRLHSPGLRYSLFRGCLIVAVLSSFVMAESTNVWLWAFSRLAAGASGIGGMLLASQFVLQRLLQADDKANLGIYFSGLGFGIALTGVVTLVVHDSLSWAGQWILLGCISLFLLIPAWLLVPRPNTEAVTNGVRETVRRGHAGTPWLILFNAGYFTAGWGYSVGATFAVAILTHSGAPGLLSPSIGWTIIGVAAAAGTAVGSYVVRRLGVNPTLLGCYLSQIIALLLLAVPGDAARAVGALLFGGTFMTIVSISLTQAALRSPLSSGAAMARMTLSYGAGQIAGPAVTGYIIANSGNYTPALLIAAAMMTVGVLSIIGARQFEEDGRSIELRRSAVAGNSDP